MPERETVVRPGALEQDKEACGRTAPTHWYTAVGVLSGKNVD